MIYRLINFSVATRDTRIARGGNPHERRKSYKKCGQEKSNQSRNQVVYNISQTGII